MKLQDFSTMAQLLWKLTTELGFAIIGEGVDAQFVCPYGNCAFPLHTPDCPLGALRDARKAGLFHSPSGIRDYMMRDEYTQFIESLAVGDMVELSNQHKFMEIAVGVVTQAGNWVSVFTGNPEIPTLYYGSRRTAPATAFGCAEKGGAWKIRRSYYPTESQIPEGINVAHVPPNAPVV